MSRATSVVHGTCSAYDYHGCRCERCCANHNERVRRNRADRLTAGRLNHGTRSAYDCGCRCDPCRAVRRRVHRREYRSRRGLLR